MADGSGGGMSLGSATFTVSANTQAFTNSLSTAQGQANSFAQSVTTSFNSLLVIPRQLSALNQTVMATTAAVAHLEQGLMRIRSSGSGGGLGPGGGMFNASGLMAFSYALDDIQYGVSAIINNVAQLGLGLGSALGLAPAQAQALAGALQIVAVVSNQVYKNWDRLFGEGNKLPTIKEGLDGLAESLSKIHERLAPLKSVFDEIGEGQRGMFGQWMDMIGVGEGSLKGRREFEQLQKLEKETKEKLGDQRVMEGMGPEHTKTARENAEAFRQAVAQLPEGSETLRGILMERGMTNDEARKSIAGGARGNLGFIKDILDKIPEAFEGGKFAPLRRALPEVRKVEKENEEDLEKFHRDEEAREKNDRLVAQLNEQGRENQRHMIRENMRAEIEDLQKTREGMQEQHQKLQRKAQGQPAVQDYFAYAQSVQESPIQQRQLAEAQRAASLLKSIDDTLKKKQKELARFE